MASRPRRRILVVNPNSNEIVTKGLADALAPVAFADGPRDRMPHPEEGPYGIETQEHVESVTLPLRRLVAGSNDVDAFVIACYSDPGLHVCREATARPVFGINEAGVLTALARASGSASSPSASARSAGTCATCARWACWTASPASGRSNMSVAETASGDKTLDRMIEIGTELRDEDGADVDRHGLRRHGAAPRGRWRRRSACPSSTRRRRPSPWPSAPCSSLPVEGAGRYRPFGGPPTAAENVTCRCPR